MEELQRSISKKQILIYYYFIKAQKNKFYKNWSVPPQTYIITELVLHITPEITPTWFPLEQKRNYNESMRKIFEVHSKFYIHTTKAYKQSCINIDWRANLNENWEKIDLICIFIVNDIHSRKVLKWISWIITTLI